MLLQGSVHSQTTLETISGGGKTVGNSVTKTWKLTLYLFQ